MKLIFIGYILVFFHFKINGIDLLPDFIGYILIANGLGQLAGESEYFEKAKSWAVVMTIVTVFSALTGLFGISSYAIMRLMNLIFGCMGLYLMYLIGHGVRDMEQKKAADFGGTKFLALWKVQAGFTITCYVLTLIPMEILAILASITMILALISNIVFLVYLYQTKKLVEQLEETQKTGTI